MMKAGTETGSLTNHMYSRTVVAKDGEPIKPTVGVGVTMLSWTDRRPGTITKVTPCQIHVQEDSATRIDKNGMCESQHYEYAPNPNTPVTVFRKTKRGFRDRGGRGLLIGVREKYYDYSF
jgi:hypothetical protein